MDYNATQRRLEVVKPIANVFGEIEADIGSIFVNSFRNDKYFHLDEEDWCGKFTITDYEETKIPYLIEQGYLKELESRKYCDSQEFQEELEELYENIHKKQQHIENVKKDIENISNQIREMESIRSKGTI